MHQHTTRHRPPRAGIDPIDGHDSAVAIIRLAITSPARFETIVMMLDHERRGIGLVVVTDTPEPDQVLGVVECLAPPSAHQGRAGAIVVASVRPGYEPDDEIDDLDRWLELSDIAESSGVELVEWLVIGRQVTCPRDLLGEPPRW